MTQEAGAGQGPDWMNDRQSFDWPIADRDYLYMLDLDFDPQPQLRAIRSLLKRNEEAEKTLLAEIRAQEEHAKKLKGRWNDHAVDECIDLMHHSIYQDAAHSMAAVGVLAPFIEGVLSQCFYSIGRKFFSDPDAVHQHERWRSAKARMWDCHFVLSETRCNKHLVEGVTQLAAASGLQKYLPSSIRITLEALFEYRNKMFHDGLEWPIETRKRFRKRIAESGWPPTWFSQATVGDEPWVFYMSEVFIEHCLDTTEKTLDAFAALIKKDLWPGKGE